MGRILILSDINSIWTIKCIENASIISNNDIFVLGTEPPKDEDYYKNNNIRICKVKRHRIIENIPKFRRWVFNYEYNHSILNLCKEYDSFDVLHISFVSVEKMHIIKSVRNNFKKIVCSFWGSDLFRASDKQLLKYEKVFHMVDEIMLTTSEMKEYFVRVFGDQFNNKIKMIRFGVDALGMINPANTEKSKKELGIPLDKTVITIGYNGKEAQNHIKVIEALCLLPQPIKDRIYIQLPVTYGLAPQYEELLKRSMEKMGCQYNMYKGYFDDVDLGHLRESSDIFIHAQISDASAASVQEYLYARKVVFNARWIQYSDLKKQGVFYFEFKDYDDLYRMILNYFNKGLSSNELERIDKNSQIIWNYSSWESVSDKWHSLYSTDK